MTAEEIKKSRTMPEVMAEYGIEIKRGMCSCPWHKDRHPSMKVFPDGAKCFSCGWTGDVFAFVQKAENCDFKTAFYRLGGNYQHEKNKRSKATSAVQRGITKSRKKRQELSERKFRKTLLTAIWICRDVIEIYEPYSDQWCECCNALPFLEDAYDKKYLEDERIDEYDVYRKSQQIRQAFYP